MPHEDAFAILYFALAAGVGTVCWFSNAPTGAYALLLIGFIFVWLVRGRVSKAESGSCILERRRAQKRDESLSNRAHNSFMKVDRGEANWVLFLTLAYASAVIGVETLSRAFGAGFSGEEKTAALIRGGGILVALVSAGVITWLRAVPPDLPRKLVLVSMFAFSLFILMAAISTTHPYVVPGSTLGHLILAGVMLTCPLWFHVFEGFQMGEKGMAGPGV